jgi:hypothetical protein
VRELLHLKARADSSHYENLVEKRVRATDDVHRCFAIAWF